MARIVLHGPHDDKECRRIVQKLAKEIGGKFSYTSFWSSKRNRWFSQDTVGKAAYCVQWYHSPQDSETEEAKMARALRAAKKVQTASLKHRVHWL
jgi:hypothetical protein